MTLMRAACFLLVSILAIPASGITPPGVTVVPLLRHELMRFVVVGDAGTGDPHLRKALQALTASKHIDGVLMAGDNIYPCGVQSVADPDWAKVTNNFGKLPVPVYPVLGNHDYGDPIERSNHYDICGHPDPGAEITATGSVPHWDFPARSYVLRSRLVDFFMIDTQPIAGGFTQSFLGSMTATGELEWVSTALSGSKAVWRIAVGHHTIFSSGEHGIANHRDQRRMREELLPLLKSARVDLYICGHDHDAELLGHIGSERKGEPLFLVSGNGAESQQMTARSAAGEPPTIFPPVFPPPPLVGFTLLEVTRTDLRITFYDQTGARRSSTYELRK